MKKYILTIFLLSLYTTSQAQLVGSAFNYQGQLVDNGTAANGQYDFILDAYTDEFGNSLLGSFSANSVMVTDGIFTITDVDYGTALLGNVVWLEISVKESINAINFEILTGRQRINAAPYAYESEFANLASVATFAQSASEAVSLSPNGAINNDVLTFDGTQWLPSANRWQLQNNTLSTVLNDASSQVTIGTTSAVSTARLTVESINNGINTQFKGATGVFNEYWENGIPSGYIGSVQDGSLSGTSADDFELGTAVANSAGSLHLTINAIPQLTVSNNGNIGVNNTSPTGKFQVNTDTLIVTNNDFVGVGTTIPGAKLAVNAEPNVGISFSVLNDSTEKFDIHQNGGASIGTGFVPPDDGLFVEGDTKQQHDSNGLMKYMVRARCFGSTSTLTSFYNGTNNSGSVSVTGVNTTGKCEINFPSNINSRYWQVSAVSTNGNHNVNCHTLVSNSQLVCQRTLSGVNNNGDIMILVY